MFLEISQNSQESTCARVSFLIKLQAEACNFIKKETLARCFPVNFAKFLRTPFPTEHLRWLLLYSTINIIKLTVMLTLKFRSSYPEVFLIKGVLKICSKVAREHPCRSVISIKLQITLLHGFSPVNLLHIFRTPFSKNTFGWLLLKVWLWISTTLNWAQKLFDRTFE